MQATPLRLLNAVCWPLTIWTSLTHLEEHPADDYVERTSPIVATAVAFWICVMAVFAMNAWAHGAPLILGLDGESGASRVRQSDLIGVLWFFLPVIYLIGFWLFTSRDEAYPR